MFNPALRTFCRGELDPAFSDDLHLFPKHRFFSQHVSKDLFIAVIAIDIGMVKGGHSDIK